MMNIIYAGMVSGAAIVYGLIQRSKGNQTEGNFALGFGVLLAVALIVDYS